MAPTVKIEGKQPATLPADFGAWDSGEHPETLPDNFDDFDAVPKPPTKPTKPTKPATAQATVSHVVEGQKRRVEGRIEGKSEGKIKGKMMVTFVAIGAVLLILIPLGYFKLLPKLAKQGQSVVPQPTTTSLTPTQTTSLTPTTKPKPAPATAKPR